MLKKFAPGGQFFCGGCEGKCDIRPGIWWRVCHRLRFSLWGLFALSSLLLFGYILWRPHCYLLIVLFLQVVGLLVWQQERRL